jgi:hypothetical protein
VSKVELDMFFLNCVCFLYFCMSHPFQPTPSTCIFAFFGGASQVTTQRKHVGGAAVSYALRPPPTTRVEAGRRGAQIHASWNQQSASLLLARRPAAPIRQAQPGSVPPPTSVASCCCLIGDGAMIGL